MIKLEKLLGGVRLEKKLGLTPHVTGSPTQAGQAEMGRHSEHVKDSKNGKLTLM